MHADPAHLSTIRGYLEHALYALVDLRLSFELEPSATGFPRFSALQALVARLDPPHAVLFRLLRLGEPVEAALVERMIPGDALASLVATGLLVREADAVRTPSLLIVPAEGLLLLVGVPPSYPTATLPVRSWFDLSSHVVARALPTSLAGQRVLDVCSGSGVQGLLCAARGAARVVALELDPEAVALARMNAALNRIEGVDLRVSDGLSALGADETFDLVVCNTPYAPALRQDEAPTSLDEIGNAVLHRVLEHLPRHLAPRARGLLASWRAAGRLGETAQLGAAAALLEAHGCAVTAYVDRAPDSLDGVLKLIRSDLEQRLPPEAAAARVGAVRELLEGSPAFDGFYNQIIAFDRGGRGPAAHRSLFGLAPRTA